MLRKVISVCCLFVLVMMACSGSLADVRRSVFDEFSEGLDTITNTDPTYNEITTLENLYSDINRPYLAAVQMWYNLLEQELRQGKEVPDTMAAEIYRGFKQGYAYCDCACLSPDAVTLNILYGIYNEKTCDTVVIYWLEWNAEKQVLQAARLVTDEKDIYSDSDILYTDTFNYWAMMAKRDPALTGPDNSISYQYDTRSSFVKQMEKNYSAQNKGKKLKIN